MKKLLKSIIFIFVLVTSIYFYFDFTVNKLNKDYLVSYGRGFQQKFNKLQDIRTKKIVIVGGSNVNFGIDSDLMEVSLGVPVVNMGLHAGLNTFNMITPVTPYLKNGDILVISREFEEELYGSSVEVSNYFQFMPLLARWETYKNLDAIAPVLKCHVQNSQNNIINFDFKPQNTFKQGTYKAKAFKNDNIKKNMIDFEMTKSMYNNIKTKELALPNKPEIFQYYKKLRTTLNYQGIKVYFSLPSINDKSYSKKDMLAYYKALSEKTGIQLLSNQTFEFPRTKLSNSEYHLNALGRKERSLKLSNDLAKLLDSKLKTVEHLFYASSDEVKATTLKFNDFRQCRLTDSILTFTNYDEKDLANYFRIKASNKDDPFTNKSFKIELEGDNELIKDIKFKAVGSPQKWDFISTDNSKHILIKNNLQGTMYKDGNSYLGIGLNRINKYHKRSVKIHKIEISDTPFNVKSFTVLPLSKYLIIDSRNSEGDLTIIINKVSTLFKIYPNRKYSITNKTNELMVYNLYTNKTTSIKKTETNQKITINFPQDLIEIYELE